MDNFLNSMLVLMCLVAPIVTSYYSDISRDGLLLQKWEIVHAESLCKNHEGLNSIVVHVEDSNRAICVDDVIIHMDIDLIREE